MLYKAETVPYKAATMSYKVETVPHKAETALYIAVNITHGVKCHQTKNKIFKVRCKINTQLN